ncbi:hypothetical protein ACHJH3_10850 [Campylobacter sp. MOP7]|uniref:hypothetical protein n=1 Tax=Campylobacter canis TaxID=3378588 RepID=UPI00387E5450
MRKHPVKSFKIQLVLDKSDVSRANLGRLRKLCETSRTCSANLNSVQDAINYCKKLEEFVLFPSNVVAFCFEEGEEEGIFYDFKEVENSKFRITD